MHRFISITAGIVVAACIAGAKALPGEGVDPAALLRAGWRKHRAMAESSIFRGLPWRSIGPVVQGGRVVDIEGVPGRPYTFYVAFASGGLWKTENNGLSFEPLFDDQPTVIMGDVALDPQHPDTVWAGTGEPNSSRSSYGGYGIFRSGDGGESWAYAGLVEGDRIARIVVDPRDSGRVYAAVLGRLYTPGGARGVYRTEDGGKTWTCVLHVDDRTGAADLVQDPKDPDVLYAAMWDRLRRPWNMEESGRGSGIWKSTDGGDTWERIEGGFPRGDRVGRIGLALAPGRPDTIYAMVDNHTLLPEEEWDLGEAPVTAKKLMRMSREEFLAKKPEDVEAFLRANQLDPALTGKKVLEQVKDGTLTLKDLVDACKDANAALFDTDIRGIELYRSDDGGAAWRKTHDDSLRRLAHTYGYYFGQVRVAPDDPDRVYLLGVPILASKDGGKHFKAIGGRGVHGDHHALWIDPGHPEHMILGNDGGINVTYDRGEHWAPVKNVAVGQFYAVTVDMAKPYYVYGGLQDNGIMKGPSTARPGRDAWTTIGGGDGMYVQVDPRDNATVYYGSQFGHYTRLDPDGRRRPVRPRSGPKGPVLRYNWCTPILLSSFNPEILYFGTQFLYRSMDKGETWSALSPDLTRSKERGDVPFATITTIAESPKRFGLLWVGTDDGRVHVTRDGGVEWKDVSEGLPEGLWVSRVEASHHEETRAYVSLTGYREDDPKAYLFRTDDLGKTWIDIGRGLPHEPVNVIREDPKNPDRLFAGTDRGAYATLDGGETWYALSGGLPNVPVHDLVIHPRDRDLVAGTHGRSVWILDLDPVDKVDEKVLAEALHIFPVEKVQESRAWRRPPSPWYDRPERRPKKKILFWTKEPGDGRFQVKDAKGHILVDESFDAYRGLNFFEWNLLVDLDRALAAEQAAAKERGAKKRSVPEEEGGRTGAPQGGGRGRRGAAKTGGRKEGGAKEKTPMTYARMKEEKLLPYILPGKYTVVMRVAGAEAEAPLEVTSGGRARRGRPGS